uniref:Pru domain-containing protein n=1 Tax=Florenciella parvula TaxID=236787 RepID=A0A7S2CKT5_9STRA|mmetsp:Transcript_30197/g.61685  ORF Transcript_30197/g.61685 Transcript_30197/m.61685 type:complete len:180 (+) Transcript_30197:52-591(+)
MNMQALMQAMGNMQGMGAPPEPLVKVKAGKMEAVPIAGTDKFTISPMKPKGQLQLLKDETGMMRFQWKDRISQTVDEEGQGVNHMIFPGDANFVKVVTGREGDRIYMLQFSAQASRRYFFWLQDKDDKDDAELTGKLNEYMNNPEAAAKAEEERLAAELKETEDILGDDAGDDDFGSDW